MTDDLQIQYKNHHHVNHENHYVYYNETNDDYEQFLGTYLAFDILACGLIISFIKTCYDKVLIGVNEKEEIGEMIREFINKLRTYNNIM